MNHLTRAVVRADYARKPMGIQHPKYILVYAYCNKRDRDRAWRKLMARYPKHLYRRARDTYYKDGVGYQEKHTLWIASSERCK
jgi:hypothetical protein